MLRRRWSSTSGCSGRAHQYWSRSPRQWARSAAQRSHLLAGLGLEATTFELIDAVKRGLPVTTFVDLARALGVSEARLAGVVGISPSSLTRRKREGGLAPAEGEHVLRVARLLERAAQVFGDTADDAAWLGQGNVSLGGATPLDLADTELGAREVDDLLGRIEHGAYS